MKPYLSACLIVKNEEDMLRRCLESLKGGVDEIVIVDTGSTDKTKEIAKEFTDKVYDFEWTNDFAEARNFAGSHATGEWILALDADECVDLENVAAAIEEIKSHNNKFDTYTIDIINFVGERGERSVINKMARIYKNDGTVHFEGAIHEQIVSLKNQRNLAESLLKVYHYGYLSNVVEKKNKRTRNMNIIKKMLQSEKENGFTYFNYGQELRALGKTEEALNAFISAYKYKGDIYKEWVGICLFFIIESLVELKRYDKALVIIKDAEKVLPTAPDFPFWKAEIYFRQKRFDDAREVYTNIVMERQTYKDIVYLVESQALLPYLRLGEIYKYERLDQKALQYYVEALNENSSSLEAIANVIKILSNYHTPKEVYEFLNSRCIIKADDIRIEVLKLILDLGLGELALLLTNDFTTQEQLMVSTLQLKAKMILGQELLQFTTEELMYGVKTEVIDVADLAVLYEVTNDARVQNVFENSKFKHVFYSIFNEKKQGKKMKQVEYLPILDKALRFQKPEFAERLISYINIFPKQVYAKVADLFYENGYEEIALEFYELADENHVTKQGYVNIIEYLLAQGNGEEAHRIALEALKKFKKDFRFYKYAIELGQTEQRSIVTKSLQEFPDSNWLKLK
ncbi:tetratricopeptide repeat-containing glycosyltransferase family 2 protein [Bacillus fungorum]|uniref:tetratricopeptide repeat-containing glycosyltransferase family 2 protein n=1 Tax=Bacillus fungorum TaxID=2039284 RepID=UPI003F54E9B5